MSTAKLLKSDKQNTTNIYVSLPAELRINVIHEFIANFRRSTPLGKLAPFAAIHGEWQHELEAEEELFGSLCLTTDDLPSLLPMLSQHRRDVLSKVTFKVWVDNASIGLGEEGNNDLAVSRTQDFIVQSMGRMLGVLDYIKLPKTQSIRTSGIEFHTEVGIPCNMASYRGLSRQLNWLEGVDCDFSQLLPTNCIRAFSSTVVDVGSRHLSASGPPWSLLLTPSSLFTLVGRMPNLERAMVCIPFTNAGDDDVATQRFNICPTLKTLKVAPFDPRPSTSALLKWTTSWSENIEHLDLRLDYVADFLRTVSAGGHSAGITAWPKLQLLCLSGRYFPEPEFYGVSHADLPTIIDLYHWNGGEALTDALGAMATALASLPCIREIRIKLRATAQPTIMINLSLRNGASKLTFFAEPAVRRRRNTPTVSFLPPITQSPTRLPFRHRMLPIKYDLSDLFPQDTIRPAIAGVRSAILTHFGLDLEVVWPKKDDEPESQQIDIVEN